MNVRNSQKFDVIILGSGLSGTLLATVLAKQGIRVLMIDKREHPRFAIGEAMTPDTDLMMEILGHQYGVPEIGYLSSFESICKHISPSSCGLKRSFNFVYHRPGTSQMLKETNKLGVEPSSHLFRQDIDYYMSKVSMKYGVTLLENTQVDDIQIGASGISIKTVRNETYDASYLVDSSGYNSLMGNLYDLREKPTRFKTNSRTIFTHMVNVKRYDDCVSEIPQDKDGLNWHQGTLHHIFKGGWMWVIPFNNHEKSANPVCSVGINFDCRHFPPNDNSPEQEYQELLSKFPSIGVQFKEAEQVRSWVATQRLQYSSKSCMGERFFLLPHAAGFIDPLYSFGLVNACTLIIPLAARIIKAVSTNNYDQKSFSDLEVLQKKLFDYNDDLVNCSYIAFRDYELWDAWRRIWILGSSMRQWKAGVRKSIKIKAGKAEALAKLDFEENLNYLTPSFEGLDGGFFAKAKSTMERVEQGQLSTQAATQKILSLISSIDFLPPNYLGLAEASRKHLDVASQFGYEEQKRFLFWIKSAHKPEVKKYFDYDIKDLVDLIQV